MVEVAEQKFGGIDVLCSNAGIFPAAKILEMNPSDWDHVLPTNLKSTFPHRKGRYAPTTGSVTGYPGWAHYGAPKAGQLRFLRTGAPNTNRTCDLPLRRGLLYPLSYRGTPQF